MKNPWEMTLLEVRAFIGRDHCLEELVSSVREAQKRQASIDHKEIIRQMDANKAELAKPPKPEPLFLSEKAFLDASEG